MACNDQLMIIYSTEVIVPGITSCPESLYTCKQFAWSRYHSRDDQVIIPQKVGGFHDAAGFTLEHMTKFPMMITLSFPEPSHRCTTLVIPCPRCHTDQFQKGVDHHEGGGALPNAIIPKSRSFPEPTARHRCNRFPCPLCHPGRTEAEDYRDEINHHVISEEMQTPRPKYQQVRGESQNAVLHNSCASAGVVLMTFNPIVDPIRTLPDGGHRCTEFPCPKCHGRHQSQNAVHGVQKFRASESGLSNPVPEVVKISFPEPTGHRCNRFSCPLCHPGRSSPPAMSTAKVDHDEIFQHHAISEEMQTPRPKYQQVRGESQNVVLDNSCASAGVVLMTFNPIVDPIRTLPDGGHRCTEFPCPKCHGHQSQNAVHGVQKFSASESGLSNPVPEVVKISFPEPTGHRCNRFPCPLCHPGRSSPPAMLTAEVDHYEIFQHHAMISEEMQTPRPKYQQVRGISQNVVLDNSCASAGVVLMTFNPIVDPIRTLPDGGHRCTEFPCPKCHGRHQSQNVVHGVQKFSASESGLSNPVPEVVKISFPEPTGHRCNRFPCPLCHPCRRSPPAMLTAEVDHYEIFQHHAMISEEMQTPRPKYQQVRGESQNVVLDNSCASARVVLMAFNPIVDPIRTLPDGGHRCTEFPCPKCHGRHQSQNVVHGAQKFSASESGLSNPVPEVVKISFPEPTGHRCNRFPCPLCHPCRRSPPAMLTAEVDHYEIFQHHAMISEEMQTPRPKYQQVRGESQNVVLDNSCASARVVLMAFNPIVDPIRTLPDGGHRCTEFPCPKCHGRHQSQIAVHGVQKFSASESGLSNPVPEVVISKHHAISEEMQTPRPKYQQVRVDLSHDVQVDH